MRQILVSALLVLLAACDMPPPPTDAGLPDAGPPQPLFATCEETMPGEMLAPVSSTLVATVTHADRMASPGTLNPAEERGEDRYRTMGLLDVSAGPGLDRVQRVELGGVAPDTSATRRSIAWFAHYSDFQLVDDESPIRFASADNSAIPGSLRAHEAYTPRAVSAMNATLTRIASAERSIDFGIITGDCAENGQFNETRWVIDLMNGAAGVHTDSGDDDDPVPGPDNDPKDPFDAIAFPAPWLYVPGNHDLLIVGITLPDEGAQARAIGTSVTGGTRDYRRRHGAVSTQDTPADPDRRLVDRAEIVAELLADTAGPGPVGHGYGADPDLSVGANYEYDAIPGVLRIIALDTNDTTGGSNGLVHRNTVDDFLIPAMERAETDGVLAMVASHHAPASIDVFSGQVGSTVVEDAVPAAELETLVASHANVIAWLVGHSHDNRVRSVPGPDAEHPGYWEIMAPAIADYPGQIRMIEVVDNGDGNLSLFVTNIDHDETTCMEQRFRRLLVLEFVTAWTDDISTAPSDVNVELVRPIPTSATAAVTGATGHDAIESETTLRAE